MRTGGRGGSLRWRLMPNWGVGQLVLEPSHSETEEGGEGGRRGSGQTGKPALPVHSPTPSCPFQASACQAPRGVGADKQVIHHWVWAGWHQLQALPEAPGGGGPCQQPGRTGHVFGMGMGARSMDQRSCRTQVLLPPPCAPGPSPPRALVCKARLSPSQQSSLKFSEHSLFICQVWSLRPHGSSSLILVSPVRQTDCTSILQVGNGATKK